jgi:hypothetical protein
MYLASVNTLGMAGGALLRGGQNAAAGPAGSSSIINISGITSILAGVLILIVLVVAIRHALHAGRGNWAAVLTGMGVLALAAMTWALATGNDIGKLGSDLVSRFLSI